MLRRLVIVALAASLATPLFAATPASGAVLFTCPSIDADSFLGFVPGLSHTQTAQDAWHNGLDMSTACSNGETGSVVWGSSYGYNASLTFGPRPLGCPVAWGGAGPDYADQTAVLLGSDGGPTAFAFSWAPSLGESRGIFKAKAGPTSTHLRLVFNITSGQYAPPEGKKTKLKVTVSISPSAGPAGGHTYTCADDSDPLEYVEIASVGSVIVQQK